MKKLLTGLLAVVSLSFVFPHIALGGFGITPPYVRNDSLVRNSVYEQKIILVRSDPVEDLKAEVTVSVPDANDWISVDRGFTFTMPKGESQVPMTLRIEVPKNAPFKRYKGYARIRISSLTAPQSGSVSIALGAQIDVDLQVVDKKIYDFRIAGVQVSDAEEGRKFAWLFFPGKIRFGMKVENIGNVPYGPTKVEFDIYDTNGNLLEKIENTNRIKKTDPFKFQDVAAELPTRLKPGVYKAKYRIYKADVVAQDGEVNLSVLPKGTLKNYSGYGVWGLNMRDKLSLVGVLVVVIAAVAVPIRMMRKRRRRRLA